MSGPFLGLQHDKNQPIPVRHPPAEPAVQQVTSADDEAFVTSLATSLVVLIARWRERAEHYAPPDAAEAFGKAAAELEAVLRSAT